MLRRSGRQPQRRSRACLRRAGGWRAYDVIARKRRGAPRPAQVGDRSCARCPACRQSPRFACAAVERRSSFANPRGRRPRPPPPPRRPRLLNPRPRNRHRHAAPPATGARARRRRPTPAPAAAAATAAASPGAAPSDRRRHRSTTARRPARARVEQGDWDPWEHRPRTPTTMMASSAPRIGVGGGVSPATTCAGGVGD